MTFLQPTQSLLDLRVSDGNSYSFDLDAEIVLDLDLGLDFKYCRKRKPAALVEFVSFHFRPRHNLQTAFLDDFTQRLFDEMRSNFAFDLIAVNALQDGAGNLTGAKTFDADPLAEILIGTGKLTRNRLGRKFHANLSLHGAQLIDVDLHNPNLPKAVPLVDASMDKSTCSLERQACDAFM